MRIIAISDIHGQLPVEPCDPCDLLIIAGDICPDVGHVTGQAKWLDTTFRAWLKLQPANKIIGTWGNHDFVGQSPNTPTDLPWTLAVNELVEVDGLKIYLTPWVPNLPRWAFSFPNDVPQERWPYHLPSVDIFVPHGPPLGYSDYLAGWHHVGSETQRGWCLERKPPVVVCGHIHEGRGEYPTVWGGKLYNVASLDGKYEPYPQRFTTVCL